MNTDYSQFLHMLPEVTLMAVFVIVLLTDLFTAPRVAPVAATESKPFKAPRGWFNCVVCTLMLVHLLINICPVAPATTFSGMYITGTHISSIPSLFSRDISLPCDTTERIL